MKLELVIWGAGGHALCVTDAVRLAGQYEIVGYLDDLNPARANTLFCHKPIFGGREQLGRVMELGVTHLFFAFGDSAARQRLTLAVREVGFELVTVIHPSAIVAEDAEIGVGTVVLPGAVIAPHVQLGQNVIINTGASVDHECGLADGVHVCPGAHLAGHVRVGSGAWIGLGAVVLPSVQIGAGSIIGAGSVVLHDIPDRVVAYGNPAKVIRGVGPNDLSI